MKYRTTVVALIYNNQGEYLLCKKPKGRGVFPGQWALVGGGIDERETMKDALRREVREEVGLEIDEIKPLYFRDDIQPKYLDGKKLDDIYMIYLLFSCKALSNDVVLDEEHEKYEWVSKDKVKEYDLNQPTKETFTILGVL